MMKGTFILLAILLTCESFGQSAPKYSNEFMNLGAGARGMAMGNSLTALANDATAGYWNPAGLLNIEAKYAGTIMHAAYFAGIANYDFAAFATPIDRRSHVGVSLLRFAVDDIPDTRFLFDANGSINYDNVRSFTAADYGLLLSYARRSLLIEGLQLGGSFKIIHRSVGKFANAWGFGFDLGAQLQREQWQFGVMLRDATGTYNNWFFNPATFFDVFAQTGNTIPENSTEITLPRLSADAARSLTLSDRLRASLSAGFDMTFDGKRNTLVASELFSLDPRAGLELGYHEMVFVRAGVNTFQRIKNFDGSERLSFLPAVGLGLRIKFLQIDYAFTDVGNNAEGLYSHVVSLNLALEQSPDRRPQVTY